jgi:hypothetical protein
LRDGEDSTQERALAAVRKKAKPSKEKCIQQPKKRE